MAGPLSRIGYGVQQGARVAWYAGHYIALNRMRGPLVPPGEEPVSVKGKVPKWPTLVAGMRELFERDWKNIAAGLYRAPDGLLPPSAAIRASLRFFKDARRVDERRLSRRHSEVLTPELRKRYPRYYLQNFHYQTGGWFSDESAKLYDTQVEVLFTGTADTMRRQALVPLANAFRGRDQRKLHLLDVACGTGRFLDDVTANYPRLKAAGLELSPAYVAEARKRLKRRRSVEVMEANAEKMPVADASQDAVTCIYLFHELPPKVRKIVAAEIARVLKPGGIAVIVDALQTGDRPDYDGLLEFFPVGFHEPYFGSYLAEDFAALFARTGLAFDGSTPAFLSKVMVFRKVVD
ncbi:methyltransferase domain-containing protein [Parvibaculum sedimenti]|uniref:Methyltransferase domain-containing protein n=1 Tax=Parvibaculum sedimenti TaxID=2608632 RepID=A0A6N6VIN6_9HYPH|nr:class I SAM-dependent methyltransferase [Parvibaculum sedimenti]KAB7739952.1 methyltransferase domain-containing protein [Parvibaculum sedimenti]